LADIANFEVYEMSSMAKKTGKKRLRRIRNAGTERKKEVNRRGTTRTELELFGNVLQSKEQ
jgi:hypothetical protein